MRIICAIATSQFAAAMLEALRHSRQAASCCIQHPLGIEDDVDPATDKKLMDRSRPLAPVVVGHAFEEAVGEQLGLGL